MVVRKLAELGIKRYFKGRVRFDHDALPPKKRLLHSALLIQGVKLRTVASPEDKAGRIPSAEVIFAGFQGHRLQKCAPKEQCRSETKGNPNLSGSGPGNGHLFSPVWSEGIAHTITQPTPNGSHNRQNT